MGTKTIINSIVGLIAGTLLFVAVQDFTQPNLCTGEDAFAKTEETTEQQSWWNRSKLDNIEFTKNHGEDLSDNAKCFTDIVAGFPVE